MKAKERIVALDILRFIATMLIFNHLALRFYGRYTFLATGGVVGCAIFFFCAGYLASHGASVDFFVYIKRRLCRLWPTCFMAALLTEIFHFGRGGVLFAVTGAGWFVQCILLHYLAYWVMNKWMHGKERIIILVVGLIALVSYVLFYPVDYSGVTVFGDGFFRWLLYFLFFLMGADVCRHGWCGRGDGGALCIALLICSLALFYGYYFVARRFSVLIDMQCLILLPLWGVVYGAWRFCNLRCVLGLMKRSVPRLVVVCVGGLSLEMYLVGRFATTFIPALPFPIGYTIAFAAAIVFSWLVRFVGRLFAQTFDMETNGYDIGKAFSLW